jgi:hypothetical protein
MRQLKLIGIALLTFGFGAAHASSCKAPPKPLLAIPDGITASRSEMLDTQRALKQYDTLLRAYALCLHSAGSDLRDAEAADKMLRELAARFNDQLELFELRSTAELAATQ